MKQLNCLHYKKEFNIFIFDNFCYLEKKKNQK